MANVGATAGAATGEAARAAVALSLLLLLVAAALAKTPGGAGAVGAAKGEEACAKPPNPPNVGFTDGAPKSPPADEGEAPPVNPPIGLLVPNGLGPAPNIPEAGFAAA